jgi:hypothetical protein
VNLAALHKASWSSVRFGLAAEPRSKRAGKVRRVAGITHNRCSRAASPEPLCGPRQKTSVKVSVAGACSLRLLLAEPGRATLRAVQAVGRCRTGRVRPVRVAVAHSGQQNQDMSLSPVFRSACAAPAVGAGNPATCSRRKAAPNWALEPTRSGSRRKPGPRPLGHHRSPGLRRLPPRAGSAQR